MSAKFSHIAKSYRIAKRREKTNTMSILTIINLIKKYKDFINKVGSLINNKDYNNAKQLLYPNLALYKEEIDKLIGKNGTQINIINILNDKIDKYINILKCH